MRMRELLSGVAAVAALAWLTVPAMAGDTMPQPTQQQADTTTMTTGPSIEAGDLIGKSIESGDESIGQIDDVVLSTDGEVQGVVVDVGGFLGIDAHPVLLPWEELTLSTDGDDVTASIAWSEEQLRALPAYEPDTL